MHVISRQCINKDIHIYQHNHTHNNRLEHSFDHAEFCSFINHWKILLVEKYQAQSGQTCLIDFLTLNVYYYSLFFAAAELGLILIVDLPHAHSLEDIHGYKINMHGKIDFVVTEKLKYDNQRFGPNPWDCLRNEHIGKHVIFKEELETYTIKDHALYDRVADKIFAKPTDPLIYSCSSGTTGLPKKLIDSHEKVYLMAQRLGRLLAFESDDKVLHTNNIHHGASMCYHFLPGFMLAKYQYTYVLSGQTSIDQIIEFIEEEKINKLFLFTPTLLLDYLRSTPTVSHAVKITTLYQITPESLQLLKEKNIQSIQSPFGDTTIGMGFFVKTVTQATDEQNYDVSNMGPQSDDFFQCKVEDSKLYVRCPDLGEDWRTSNDLFELINGNFYFKGRANQYRINSEWIKLNELEAKINELFGLNGASIVVDPDMQKIYLAIWKPNAQAEKQINKFMEDNYENVTISYVLRNGKFEHFYNSRKIDNSKIREVCRKLILQHENVWLMPPAH